MQVIYFYDYLTNLLNNVDKSVVDFECNYWFFDQNRIKIDWSLYKKKLYQVENYRNQLKYYDDDKNVVLVDGNKQERIRDFPDRIKGINGRGTWVYDNNVWRKIARANSAPEIMIYDQDQDVLFEAKVQKFFYAGPDGCIVTENGKLVKRSLNGEVVWQKTVHEHHAASHYWPGKNLFFINDLTLPDCRLCRLDSGEELFSLPWLPGSKQFKFHGDNAYLLMENHLYIFHCKEEPQLTADVILDSAIDPDQFYFLNDYFISVSKSKHLSIINRQNYQLLKTIDVSQLDDGIRGIVCNENGIYFMLTHRHENDDAITRSKNLKAVKVVHTTIEELLSSDELTLEAEHLNCQQFIVEPSPDREGMQVRIVPESSLDFDTLSRHLPIGVFRAAFSHGHYTRKNVFLEGKPTLKDFNGVIMIDLSEYSLQPKEVEFLKGLIDRVENDVDQAWLGSESGEYGIHIRTNHPGLLED
ncbi:hypothetical protein [Gynuella sunshinyii]|uniref:Uncharacterized protein n=1 Tax=Gynuella sunshinyii YC6258 TaxID=1445510 RepID=A0A0C5VFB2_9GAMM|nr:hypothetical protein [Gynuella sunshinyii]AJQ92846.1 hypothetical Protein YC6258_00796 [Gynuella sunshinyii YC6258]